MPKHNQTKALGALSDFSQPPEQKTPLEALEGRVLILERKLENVESLLMVMMEQFDDPRRDSATTNPKQQKPKVSKPKPKPQSEKNMEDQLTPEESRALTDAAVVAIAKYLEACDSPVDRHQIAAGVDISKSRAARALKRLLKDGKVNKEKDLYTRAPGDETEL